MGDFTATGFINISTIDLSLWLARHGGSILISAAVISISLGILAVIIQKSRRYHLFIPVAFFILSITFTILYPRVITPLFYNTSRVEDPVLNEKILDMCGRAGITVSDVYVLHTGAYSLAANAYLTGMGSQRRIYLYDTLLTRFTSGEILSILAHEMCHYREEHMLIGISLGAMGIFFLFPLLGGISRLLWGKDLREMTEPKNHPALVLLLGMILFFANPLENSLSRIMERRADRYSLELAGDPATYITMEINLARTNKSNLLPHPFFSWFYGSHPTVMERIRSADDYTK